MSHDVYQAPNSIVEKPEEPQLTPIKKPWQRWIIAAWILLTFGVFPNAIGKLVASYVGGGDQIITLVAAVFALAEIALIVGVIRLSKSLIYATSVSCLVIGVYQSIRIVEMLILGSEATLVVVILMLYVVPSFMCVWYFLRLGFLKLIEDNRRYIAHTKMQKHIGRQLQRGT